MPIGAAAWTIPSRRRAAAPASPRTGSTMRKVRPVTSRAIPSSESRPTASANGSTSSIDTRWHGRRMPDVDVHRLFDRVAHLYDTGWLQRALYAAVQERALAELRSRQPRSVLDVGCGTGIFATRLEQELAPGGVVGCDLSAGMLAEAAGRSRRVGWVRGDSARLPLRSGAFDAVVCTQAFHFFDQPAAWAEFRRVLAPGGHALVGMFHPRTEVGSRRIARWSSA